MNTKVVYKTYILLVPLGLYLVLMYRMLESTCQDSRDVLSSKNILYLPSETRSRKIMQLQFQNETNRLEQLMDEIKYLEIQRKTVEDALNNIKTKAVLNEKTAQIYRTNGEGQAAEPPFVNKLMTNAQNRNLMFNCTNIHMIQLKSKIGHGVTKQTFEGDYHGLPVAVKMVTRHQSDVKTCINAINISDPKSAEQRSRCFAFPTMKLMKEILLLEQLDHPGFVKLLGYCVRSEESDTSDLSERGVVSVFELGQKVMFGNVQFLTWQERIRHAIALADFLHYLENSPLGSLRIRDFKEGHFLMVQSNIKMIDLDDVDNLEPNCDNYLSNYDNDATSKNICEFSLPCMKGLCIGFNAKQNLKYMNKIFFKRLLYPNMFPKSICDEVGFLNADIDSYITSALEISERLSNLFEKGIASGT